MQYEMFFLVSYDEGGPRENEGIWRLVCRTDGGGKLAIWGHKDNMTNIDLVRNSGLPCTVRCQWIAPKRWAVEKYGHTNWVSKNAHLEIVQTPSEGVSESF